MAQRLKRQILITARTYPELSTKYRESVCTGGVFMDTREWCRIYPMPARYLEAQVKRWDVIEATVWQDPSQDPRPESWKIDPQSIKSVEHVGTGKGSPPDWARRRELLLSPERCFSSVETLEGAQRANRTSLGIIVPRAGAIVRIEPRAAGEQVEWEQKHEAILAQVDLFQRPKELDYMPFRPVVSFRCAGTDCTREHNCSVLDWEIYQLARGSGWDKAREKLEELLNQDEYETRLMMGNFRLHTHSFGIVGLFYPKRGEQGLLL